MLPVLLVLPELVVEVVPDEPLAPELPEVLPEVPGITVVPSAPASPWGVVPSSDEQAKSESNATSGAAMRRCFKFT